VINQKSADGNRDAFFTHYESHLCKQQEMTINVGLVIDHFGQI